MFARTVGQVRIDEIRRQQIVDFISLLRSPDRNGKKRSMSTMNRIKSTFRSFFAWAFRSGIVRYDYAGFIYLGKARSRPTIPMTLAEVRQFLSTIRVSGDKNKLRDETLFSIYAFTGLRRSEVVRLQIVDYDPVENKILAARTKGGEPRIHPVPSLLSDILNQWIHERHGNMLNVQDGPLFPGQHINHPITARQAQYLFIKWKLQSGIRKILTIHSFRSFFATSLYEVTKDLLLVSRALGHQDIRTTARYIDMDTMYMDNVIEMVFS
ncbi:MAG: hypothetical protein CVU74_04205 [Deltaproteobacteria bacterium HGW-Deltaproteobacteria-9]|nr:MAG: hypothetical protein CVU74_04205 [Deltaproteobacteria bacterium HGW-Deltaproteobacteria-9]